MQGFCRIKIFIYFFDNLPGMTRSCLIFFIMQKNDSFMSFYVLINESFKFYF